MSDSTLVITPTLIEVVSTPTNTFVTQVVEVHAPIISAAQGPQGIAGISTTTSLAEMADISLDILVKNGSILVYDTSSQLWKSTTVLENQAIECGQY